MAIHDLEQGIQSIQGGKNEEGARLLRIALKSNQLPPNLQAVALMWLAETNPDPNFKIDCYRRANAVDPSNNDVNQRLSHWLSQSLPGNPNNPLYPPNSGNTAQAAPPAGNAYPGGGTPPQGMPPQNMPPQNMPPVNNPYTAGGTPPQNMPPMNNPYPTGAADAQGMPIVMNQVQRSVGISGGPNGVGTGFFVTRDGLIATTRHVVGGETQLQIELLSRQILIGNVVRAFPAYDLAFIQVSVQLAHLMRISNQPLAPNTPIVAVTHSGTGLNSVHRETRHVSPPQWFPTMINHLADAGGNPIFLSNGVLVGMLTKNASRANGYYYGLDIHMIYHCLNQYLSERQHLSQVQVEYCRQCGSLSQAAHHQGYYCEYCGSTLPGALEIRRRPLPQLAWLYGEDQGSTCPNCQAHSGFHHQRCLRCGYEIPR